MSLLDQITGALGTADNVSSLMGGLRTNEADTRSMLGSAIPAVLAGLGAQSGGDGAGALPRPRWWRSPRSSRFHP